jgi:UDPglucose 6-dehydrogenase
MISGLNSSYADAIGFVGGGHLAVVSAIAAAEKTASIGTTVWCYGDPPIDPPINGVEEPEILVYAKKHVGRLKWTSKMQDLSRCCLVYFALDIPTDEAGNSQLSIAQALLDKLLPVLNEKAILVNLSQVPPGWTRRIDLPKERLFYQVETLIFGQALQRALSPERFIVGSFDKTEPLPPCYQAFLAHFNCPVLVMAYESGELAKISINLYLASAVTTTNMLAELCTQVGAQWQDIAPSLRLDPRIGPLAYLSPGLGITSGNIKRDIMTTRSLAQVLGVQASLLDAMMRDSRYRSAWVMHQLKYLGFFKIKKKEPQYTLAILGLRYKPNTMGITGSAAMQLLSELPQGTTVRVFDPMPARVPAMPLLALTHCQSPRAAVENADLILILTPDAAIGALDWAEMAKKMQKPWVLDPFSVLDPACFPMLKIWQLGVRGPEIT